MSDSSDDSLLDRWPFDGSDPPDPPGYAPPWRPEPDHVDNDEERASR